MAQARTWMLSLAVAGMVAGTGLAQDAPAGDAGTAGKTPEQVAALIETFKKVKDVTPDGDALTNALHDLAAAEHKDVLAPMAKCLADPRERVAKTAAKLLARVGKLLPMKDRRPAVVALGPVTKSSGLRAPVAVEALNALGELGDVAIAPSLIPLIESKDFTIAAAAVQALGKLPIASAIEPLCQELLKLEPAPRGSGDGSSSGSANAGGFGGGGAGGVGSDLAARIQAVKAPILAALTAITGQNFQTSLEWRRWWKTAKATFRVKTAEPAPATAPAK